MRPLPILRPFGSLAIGNIRRGNGFGYQAIGRDLQGFMRFGSQVIGNRGEEVGSGFRDTGNIVK
jgi:hypothetical protein